MRARALRLLPLIAALALAAPLHAASAPSPVVADHAACKGKELTMTYATRADLADRFGAGEMDLLAPLDEGGASARADAALADASTEIDAVLAEGYDLPLPAGEYPLLKAAACDLARLRLYDEAAPDVVLRRASSARKRVRQLAAGVLHLLTFQGKRIERRPGILVAAGEPVATRERLAGYLMESTRDPR